MSPIPSNEPKRTSQPPTKVVYDAIVIDDDGSELAPTPKVATSPIRTDATNQAQPQVPQASFVERLLSPQSLQIMMSAGGGILVLGLVVWLWSIGLFENPFVAAVSMGVGNLAILAGGIFLYTRTRYQLAGRGLTLLSTLTLPLHLWFYDAQELISLDEGGHLWIPALFICGILAATARATRDSMFAYTLVGGVVLTGLLFLANPAIGALWTALPLSTFLIVTGAISIHAINVFSEKEGAFSKKQFGTAFFNAGHIVLISGLAVLCTRHFAHFLNIAEMTQLNLFWSLGALALAAYSYAFSHFNEKRYGVFFLVLASVVGLWMSITVLDLLAIKLTFNLVLCLVALAILTWNVWVQSIGRQGSETTNESDVALLYVGLPVVGLTLAIFGIGQSLLAIKENSMFWDGTFCAQLVLSAMALVSFPGVWRKTEADEFSTKTVGQMICLIAGSICLGIFPVLIAVKVLHLSVLFALGGVLLIPAMLSAIGFAKGFPMDSNRCRQSAMASTTATLFTILVPLQLGTLVFATWPTMILFVAIATIYFCIAQASSDGRGNNASEPMRVLGNVGGTLASLIALAQVAIIMEIDSAHVILNAAAAIGVVVIGIAKALQFARTDRSEKEQAVAGNAESITAGGLLTLGNVFLVAASVGSLLFVGTKLLNGSASFPESGLLAIQMVAAGLAWVANSTAAWRKSFLVAGSAMASLAAAVLISKVEMNPIQLMEVVSVVVGLVAIVSSYIGWSKEKEEQNDVVSIGFAMGAFLLALPMVMGIIGYRMQSESVDLVWRQIHEVGALVIGLGLLTSGVLSKIRSTTIGGATVMIAYIGSILFLVRLPEQLQSVSVLLMLGGGLVFGSGILLSLYRDRLLALPAKIREGSGVFSFLKWR